VIPNGTGNVAETFVAMMNEEADRLHDLLHADEDMKPLTMAQKQQFHGSKNCHLCEEPFMTSCEKVKDHCHYT
jgi:DNA polymerase II small subunit/DNA polymerase delta subunit B